MKKPTLKEIEELVTFERRVDGMLYIKSVRDNVYGSVYGSVLGDVKNDVFGKVRGEVLGDFWA